MEADMAVLPMNYNSKFENFMDGWRHVIEVSERTLVDNIAATVPWLAPVAPAYMTWHNVLKVLGWPDLVAFLVAMAVEGLGLSVVSTAFSLWRAGANTFKIAVGTVVFYLVVIIAVNVGLDLGWPHWVAKALLSLLSVPGVVTLALRSQLRQDVAQQVLVDVQDAAQKLAAEEREYQRKLEAEAREYQRRVDEQERERRFELKKLAKVSGEYPVSSRKVAGELPETYADWRDVPESEYEFIRAHSPAEIVERYHLGGKDPERKARNWKTYAGGK
jgi:hypothetical protein